MEKNDNVVNMKSYYLFAPPESRDQLADFGKRFAQWERIPCPISTEHLAKQRRSGTLHHFVKHNSRDELIIWGQEIAVHWEALRRIEAEGFTGFRTQEAKVTFRDGVTSDEYREFIVTGWAGVSPPESGVHVLESCSACKWKNYSPITNFEKIIDWTQWTGEDFFIVWPFSGHKLCTKRVADWLKSSGLRSFAIEIPFERERRYRFTMDAGFPRGPLSEDLPEDLAIKYGRLLGLE